MEHILESYDEFLERLTTGVHEAENINALRVKLNQLYKRKESEKTDKYNKEIADLSNQINKMKGIKETEENESSAAVSEIFVGKTGMDDAVNRLNKILSDHEIMDVLVKVWDKVPLGARMNQGGMPREIPGHIKDGLKKLGYTIIRNNK